MSNAQQCEIEVMTDYTGLKARLREALDVRLSLNEKIIPVGEAEVKRILAAIEELEQRSSMGGSSDAGSASDGLRVAEADSRKVEPATSVKDTDCLNLFVAPAQPAQADEGRKLLRKVAEWYHHDGSVGGCSLVMDDVDAYLARTGGKEET